MDPTMAVPHLDVDAKLGSAFIGCVMAGILYGITCFQTYNYYKGRFEDPWTLDAFVYSLWTLETVHLGLVMHGCYFYMVTNYNNPASMISPTWSLLTQIFVTCVTDVAIRGFFGRRVWILTAQRNRPLAYVLVFCIGASSLLTFSSGVAFGIKAFMVGTFAAFNEISYLLYTSLGSGVVADAFIAVSMCVLLSQSRTGVRNTDSVIDTLMMYTINTSLLTTVCSAACFISYAVRPNEFIFLGIYFVLSEFFINSLLASLNARTIIRSRSTAKSDTPAARTVTLQALSRGQASTDTSMSFPTVKTTDAYSVTSPRGTVAYDCSPGNFREHLEYDMSA
ncbi:hypothetical protein K525DRAFT_280337 [Schizophyllum commune Loenen D]|nr:hypothetical protein K525DRAFT_280337 [Schizophyllum commune Loenen D]